MRITRVGLSICALWSRTTCALLEEQFVGFTPPTNTSINIAGASIVADRGDSIGIHIALRSLASDLEQITGSKPSLLNATSNATISGSTTSIIIGSVESSLIHELSAKGLFDTSDIEGKWEVFKTAVVDDALAGVKNALVIAGSDKRGTIFGIHTLAEQCGQSPYVQHYWT